MGGGMGGAGAGRTVLGRNRPLALLAVATLVAALLVGSRLSLEHQSQTGVVVTEGVGPATTTLPTTVTPVSGTQGLPDVACMTPTSCVAVGAVPNPNNPSSGAVVPITNGVPGASVTVSGATYLAGVACPSSTFCVAVGEDVSGNGGFGAGVVVPITNGSPGGVQDVSTAAALVGVACTSTASCWGVGWSTDSNGYIIAGALVPITTGSPGAAVDVGSTEDELYRIACATDSATSSMGCVAVGGNGANGGNSVTNAGLVVPINNGVVGGTQTVSGVGWLNAVACTSTTSCVAVGEGPYGTTEGVVVPITGGTPGTVQTTAFLSGRGYAGIDAVGTGGVACASQTACVAAGYSSASSSVGEWLPINRGVPGSPQAVSGTDALAGVTFTGAGYLGVGFTGPATGPTDVLVSSPTAPVQGGWQPGTADVSGGP